MKRIWKLLKRKKGNNRGVTLIEAMVATVVLALAVIPLMNSIVTAAKVNAKARYQQERNTLCMTIMEQVKAETLRGMYLKRLDVQFDDTVSTMDIAGHTVTGADISTTASSSFTSAWYGEKEYMIPGGNLAYHVINSTYTFKINNIDGYYVKIYGIIDTSNKDSSVQVGYKSYSDHGLAQYIQYTTTVSLYKTEADMDAGTNAVESYTGSTRDFVFIKYEDPN